MTETETPQNTDGRLQDIEHTVGMELLKRMHMELVQLQTPWQNTPEERQEEVLNRLRLGVSEAVGIAVRRIIADGFPCVTVSIDSLTIKDEAKAAIGVPRFGGSVQLLAENVGKAAVLVIADRDAYLDGMDQLKAQADQQELPLEPLPAEGMALPVDPQTGEILPAAAA